MMVCLKIQGGPVNLELDFLLVPSEAELQDASSDDVYSGPLFYVHQSGRALENECCDIVKRWSDVALRWSSGEDPLVANYAPAGVITMAMAWIGSATGASLLYKLLKLWVGTGKRKIMVKLPGGLHIETTQLSANQFVELLGKLSDLGLVTTTNSRSSIHRPSKDDRFSYLPEKNEKAFKKVLDALKADGVEVLDADAIADQERMLHHLFMHTLGKVRNSPDMKERSDRFSKYVEEWIAKGRPAPYLSSPEERDQWLAEIQREAENQQSQEARCPTAEQPPKSRPSHRQRSEDH